MKWEKEAALKLERVPVFARKIAQAKIEKIARTKGKTVVTLEDVIISQESGVGSRESKTQDSGLRTQDPSIDRFAILKRYDKYVVEDGEPLLFNIEACRGEENNCPFNILGASKLSKKIKDKLKELKFSNRLLEKTKGPILPHQIFKIGVAGCPNSCSQPQIKDLGVHARALVYVDETCACTGCRRCIEACKEDAITIDKDRNVTISNEKCVFCGLCAEVCPTGTIKIEAKGYRIMVGGMLGRHPRFASDLIGLATESEVMDAAQVCTDLILSESGEKRFGVLVKELGIEEIKKRLQMVKGKPASGGLDIIDKKILERIQTNLPLCSRPFLSIAEELSLEEDLVIERVKRMIEMGSVRRLAPIINTQAVGRSATLAAMRVPEDRIKDVSEIINGYDGVSHNYLRKGRGKDIPYNIWFTMSASNEHKLMDELKEIETRTGLTVRSLPTLRKFKIGVKFKIYDEAEA